MQTLYSRSLPSRENLQESQEEDKNEVQKETSKVIKLLDEVESPVLNMNNPNIVKGFPVFERLGASCTNLFSFCSRSTKKYVTRTYTSEHMKTQTQGIYDKLLRAMQNFREKVLYLKIHDTNGLELDPNVIHPFVRVHFMDLNTQSYILKSSDRNVLGSFEGFGQINASKEFSSGEAPYVLPFSTPPCDLRVTGENDPHFDQEFILDEEAYHLLTPDTVILFEILDFNFRLIREKSKLLRKDNLYPIAWGFLRPVGNTKLHFGVSKLQLYRYRFKNKTNFKELRRPEVFYDFNWYAKELYPSFLRVELRLISPPKRKLVQYPSLTAFEREVGGGVEELEAQAAAPQNMKVKEELDPEAVARAKRLARWRRLYSEACQLPNKLAYKFSASKLGCWRLAFSNSGKYLAASCIDEESTIKVFQVEDGKLAITLRGHADIVHDLAWSHDDYYLMSSSSDGTAKIWNFSKFFSGGMDIMGYTQTSANPGTAEFCLGNMNHPSYVYSGKFHPQQLYGSEFLVASACFDGRVRFWSYSAEFRLVSELNIVPQRLYEYNFLKSQMGSTAQERAFLEHRHPNVVVFDQTDKLYVGDSLGMIHIVDVGISNNTLNPYIVRQIEKDELSGDPISQMALQPPDFRFLLVQSRDNVHRRLELDFMNQENATCIIDTSFFGSKCSKFAVKSCVSPDGSYLASGSEDGKLNIWDIATGFQVDVSDWEVNMKDLVSDVAWNSTYNMVAVAGFGSELPILVFVYEKSQEDADALMLAMEQDN